MLKATFPSGTYYIGDPSYVVRGEEGYHWIESVWSHFYNGNKGCIEVNGVKLFLHSSYEGDGVFDGFFVDSGCIAVIKIDDLLDDNRFNFKNFNIRGTKFIKFDHDFEIIYNNGLFKIGKQIIINTNLSE